MTHRERARLPRRLAFELGGHIRGTTTDVCAEGLAAELDPVFVPGSRVAGTLHLGFCDVPFTGEVTWARAGRPDLALKSRLGIRFDEAIHEAELAGGQARPRERIAYVFG